MITHSGQTPGGAAPDPHGMYAGAHGVGHGSNNWTGNSLGIDPRLGRQFVHVLAGVLGTAAALLFISIGFALIPINYAIFGGIACSMLAGLVERVGRFW